MDTWFFYTFWGYLSEVRFEELPQRYQDSRIPGRERSKGRSRI